MPVGLKNATDGDVQVAVDAVAVAGHGHAFPGVDDSGTASIFTTTGNHDCHVVLRGGATATNYDAAAVGDAVRRLRSAERVVVDASHGNSNKQHERQSIVIEEIAARLARRSDRRAGSDDRELSREAPRPGYALTGKKPYRPNDSSFVNRMSTEPGASGAAGSVFSRTMTWPAKRSPRSP